VVRWPRSTHDTSMTYTHAPAAPVHAAAAAAPAELTHEKPKRSSFKMSNKWQAAKVLSKRLWEGVGGVGFARGPLLHLHILH
jgi:hypothetical protein